MGAVDSVATNWYEYPGLHYNDHIDRKPLQALIENTGKCDWKDFTDSVDNPNSTKFFNFCA